MWTSTVDFDELKECGRWKVEFFCPLDLSHDKPHNQGFASIGELVKERRETVEPKTLGNSSVNYIGLEHVQSLTGELVGFAPRVAKSIKSRSKVFQENDVLFGRLRPNLNKVWLAHQPASEGICSTEFLVLIPNIKLVSPTVLRYLLSSHYVQRHAIRLQTGTALPRMSLDDLLHIKVPVPSMKVQRKLESALTQQFSELMALRARVREFPDEILRDFLSAVEAA